MGFDDPDMIACAKIVEKGDPDRFRAAMAAPVEARLKLFPIFAANVEIARAPWVTQEAMIAEMRLQWWRDVAEGIEKGGLVRRHEVVTPLAQIVTPQNAGLLDQLVAARRWDIYKDPFEDADHFTAYITQTSANLVQLCCDALGGADAQVVADYGYAQGLANFLNAIPALEKAKRIPLTDGRAEAVAALAQHGLDRLASAQKRRGDIAPLVRAAFLPGWQAYAILSKAAALPQRVADGTLSPNPLRSSMALLWQAQTGRF